MLKWVRQVRYNILIYNHLHFIIFKLLFNLTFGISALAHGLCTWLP